MRAKATFDETQTPPLLTLWIHGAPHRRDHDMTLKVYRACIYMACWHAGMHMPIESAIYLKIEFVDPTSPDLGNLYLALERVLDGSNPYLGRHRVLTDDSLIKQVQMGMLENAALREVNPNRLQLPKHVAAA